MLKDPVIKEEKKYVLIGMNFFGDPFTHATIWSEDNAIGQLWKRFGSWMHSDLHTLDNMVGSNVAYELHLGSEQMYDTGEYEVFTGVEVASLDMIPLECVGKVLPATEYAEFTLIGEEIVSDWSRWIYEGWMPHSGYQASADYSIQVYDETFKGMDNLEGAQIKVLVPVKKAGDAE